MLHSLNFRALRARVLHRPSPVVPNVPRQPIVVALSDVGQVRARNEDSFCVLPEVGVAVVADGMGGHPGGDVASRIAAETAAKVLAEALTDRDTQEDSAEALRVAMMRSVARAHEFIRAEGAKTPELQGMGTTLTAVVIDAASRSYVLGHVGDSRAYLFRNGRLVQLTRDDTWVQERLDAEQLTPEQARNHPFAHLLTQCLGLPDPPVPHILDGQVEADDVYLLCTDGLVGMLADEELASILSEYVAGNGSASAEVSLRALLDAANQAGGYDNITAALVRISD